IIGAAATDTRALQLAAPRRLRLPAHLVETQQPARPHALAAQVVACAFRVDMRDRADRGHRMSFSQVETEPRAVGLGLAFHAVARSGNAALFVPCTETADWAIELDAEPGGVLA